MHIGRVIIAAPCRSDPVVPRQPPGRGGKQDLLGRLIEQHHRAAGGPDLGAQRVGAELPAQPQRQVPGIAQNRRRRGELQKLPALGAAIPDRQQVRPREQPRHADRLEIAAGHPHPQGRPPVPQPRPRRRQRAQRLADHRPRRERGVERIALVLD
ncbi:hypothetical protein SDC9_40138 [bioreactor metagenome]|uniref:Uncharacterized protein n=1 Tax=bioreactor metagenome TaxID=1076179 RepID=A0A644VS11_9ZZZZ